MRASCIYTFEEVYLLVGGAENHPDFCLPRFASQSPFFPGVSSTKTVTIKILILSSYVKVNHGHELINQLRIHGN